jgi:hypothetical protein
MQSTDMFGDAYIIPIAGILNDIKKHVGAEAVELPSNVDFSILALGSDNSSPWYQGGLPAIEPRLRNEYPCYDVSQCLFTVPLYFPDASSPWSPSDSPTLTPQSVNTRLNDNEPSDESPGDALGRLLDQDHEGQHRYINSTVATPLSKPSDMLDIDSGYQSLFTSPPAPAEGADASRLQHLSELPQPKRRRLHC